MASGATTARSARTTTTTPTPTTTSTAGGPRTSTRPRMLVEWCCEQNSRLASWFDNHGHASLRLCLPAST
eukprot:9527133-Heterocapsa_arctica.AAC.1